MPLQTPVLKLATPGQSPVAAFGEAFTLYQKAREQTQIKQILATSKNYDEAIDAITKINPNVGTELRKRKNETELNQATIRQFDDIHVAALKKLDDDEDDALSGVLYDLEKIDEPTLQQKVYEKYKPIIEKVSGEKMPTTYDTTVRAISRMFQAKSAGRKQLVAEEAKAKEPMSPTWLQIQRDTPENRGLIESAVQSYLTAKKMDPVEAQSILAVNKAQGAWHGAAALREWNTKVGGGIALERGKAPIEISTAAAKETIKTNEELRKEKESQAQKEMTAQKSGTESADNVLTAITEIEKNPTVLEKLPAGWANVGGAVAKFLPAESAGIYASNLDRITNIMSLESRNKLKGQGQISDFEGKMLAAAATNIKTGTAQQRRTEMARIKDLMTKVKYRADNNIVNIGGEWVKVEGGKKTKVDGNPPNQIETYNSEQEARAAGHKTGDTVYIKGLGKGVLD